VLRATTESMSAIIGGADSLTVRPFTFAYKETSKFSGRLAQNIQIILKEEAYLGNIADPAAGSYYIENITDRIIDETWALFLKIEEAGGYLSALKKGIIQSQIDETARIRKANAATRREVFLGTNLYANPQEKITDDMDEDIAFPAPLPGDKLVAPVVKHRATLDFEKLRLATERHAKCPKVFLFTLGNLNMRKARAAFASDFFAIAGYKILYNPGFENPEKGVDAALQANADIVVVCSSDDEYAENVPRIQDLLKDQAILVVAGAPACMDELKERGVEHFIHLRSDILECLKEFHLKLGIKSTL
jgi:methylmalonyl-CoA mutase